MNHRCEFCGTYMHRMEAPSRWEWFTGHFDRTVTFCPSCRAKHQQNIYRLLQAAYGPAESRLSADAAIRFIWGERDERGI